MSSAQTLIAALANPAETENVRRFYKGGDTTTEVMGVSIGNVFPVAKGFVDMPLDDVEALLNDRRYEVRMAAVSIMDFKACRKKLPEQER